MASVFDLAQARAASANAVTIRRDVPIPPPCQVLRRGFSAELLERLPPGGSCELRALQAATFVRYAREHGVRLITRKLDSGRIGVWRPAP